jgi:hypothetical protein
MVSKISITALNWCQNSIMHMKIRSNCVTQNLLKCAFSKLNTFQQKWKKNTTTFKKTKCNKTKNVSIGHGCPHTPLFCQSYDISWATCFTAWKLFIFLLSKGQDLYKYRINTQANPKVYKYTCCQTFL